MAEHCLPKASDFYSDETRDETKITIQPCTSSDASKVLIENVKSDSEDSGSTNQQTSEAIEVDPKLDVTSEKVNWDLCVSQRQLTLPKPNAILGVNITDIDEETELFSESLTKEVEKEKAAEFSTTKIDKDRKKKQADLRDSKRDERKTKFESYNLLTSNVNRKGPQSLLSKALKSHRKVAVVTRSFKGIRGICVGFVLAFDRYCNICLIDVCEIWRIPLYGGAFFKEEPLGVSQLRDLFLTSQKSTTVTVLPRRLQKRNVSQMFVNGSSIVLVTFLEPVLNLER